jgi:plastocyanin
MRSLGLSLSVGFLAVAVACGGKPAPPPAAAAGPSVDAATAATITATVKFEGAVPAPEMIVLTGDPKCVSENGSPQRPDEKIVVGDNQALENVFVYVKDGLGNYVYDTPTTPAKIDQKECRYHPHVFGMRVGQPLEILNSDPTLHNIHAMPKSNSEFNNGQPIQGMKMTHTFDKKEIMVPFKCDVHGWMNAYVGVLNHPYFAVTDASGTFTLKSLPPGTYTIEAWHEKLGTMTQTVTVGAKETKEIAFTFKAPAAAAD